MARSFSLPQQAQIVSMLAPAADAAGRTSLYSSLKNALKAYIVVSITQGAANTVLLTPLPASAGAGTGSKAIQAVPIWANLDVVASDALPAATAAVNYTTDAGIKNKIVIFEIDPASLDVANGFTSVAVSTGASVAGNITSALLIVVPGRFVGAAQPSVLTD